MRATKLGKHEAWLRTVSIVKAEDEDLKQEYKLASELISQWRKAYTQALRELFELIPEELNEEAGEIVLNGLADALGLPFGQSQAVRTLFRKYITNAYSRSRSKFTSNMNLSLSDVRAIEVLTRHNCYWLGEHYGRHIGTKIAKRTQQAILDGIGRKELAEDLRISLGGEIGGYKYWDVVSSAALVRSRSFGAISGMEEAGITEYEVLAMNDERMCEICGEMDGKVFSVSDARAKIDSVIDIENPEEFKEAMPWQSKSPAGKSDEELMLEGMSIPPFHGRCRCVLVMHE